MLLRYPLLTLIALIGPVILTASAAPFISEFSAAGQHILEDKDADFPDWIEIQNPDAEKALIGDYYLTNDPANLTKWKFPSGQAIQSGQRLVIFASGKDRNDIFRGTIHTNFRLQAKSKGFLALVAEDGVTIIDNIEGYPKQRLGSTYGRRDDGQEAYFALPTPGEPNSAPASGFVKDTKFSVDRGYHDAPFDLTISSETEGAIIRYTLDGSVPSPDNGIVYQQTLRIDKTSLVRAIASKEGLVPSDVDTQSYLFIASVLAQSDEPEGFPARWGSVPSDYAFDTSVATDAQFREALLGYPSISLITDLDAWFNASRIEGEGGIYANSLERGSGWEKPISAEFINFEGLDDHQIDCGIRIFGNASRQTSRPKHNMRLVFRSQYGPTKLDFPVFGKGKATGINGLLFNGQNGDSWFHPDIGQRSRASYIRDHFAHEILGDMGHLTPPHSRAHVYVNGLYWGFYQTVERVDHHFMARLLGGEAEEYDSMKASTQSGPTVVAGDNKAYEEMFRIADAGLASAQAYAEIQNYLDLDQFVDYMLVNFWSGNRDWDHNNWRSGRHRSEGSPFHYFLWDSENMFKDAAINRIATNTADNPTRLHQRLTDNAAYQLKFADRVRRHLFNDGVLTEENVKQRWVRWADHLRPGLRAESARWGDHHRAGNPHTVEEDFEAALEDLLVNMFPARAKNTLRQLDTAKLYPMGVLAVDILPQGGSIETGLQVKMNAGSIFEPQSGEFLYTLDGSDPMLGNAASYDRKGLGFVLEQSAIVSVRARDEEKRWGPLTQARFLAGTEPQPGELVISEIHYHPASPSAAENPTNQWSATDFEFVEVWNVSDHTLQLEGCAFTEGIRFTFPALSLAAGERLVVVEDQKAFVSRYGTALEPRIAGRFQGNLSNGGEQLTLTNASGVVLHGVLFDDANPWPAAPDGDGQSLTLTEKGQPELAASWAASAAPGGSPASEEAALADEFREWLGGNDPLADYRDSGLGNLIAYALALDLLSKPGKLEVEISDDDRTINLSITARAPTSGTRLIPERSQDLTTWTQDIESSEVTPLDRGLQRYRWQSTRPSAASALFFRLRIQTD